MILRPVHILGGVHNAPSNYLRLPYVPTLLGFDPDGAGHPRGTTWSRRSCARSSPACAASSTSSGPGEVPLSTILRELGQADACPIPHPLAKPLLTALWRGKLTSFPVPELDHIRFVCMVDGTRAREHARLPAASHAQRDHPRGERRR